MKIKIELEKDESIEDAEKFLEKASNKKQDLSGEKYEDEALNEFHDMLLAKHKSFLHSLKDEIQKLLERGVSSNGF